MAEFCSARSNIISPLQWTSLSPPLTIHGDTKDTDNADMFFRDAVDDQMFLEGHLSVSFTDMADISADFRVICNCCEKIPEVEKIALCLNFAPIPGGIVPDRFEIVLCFFLYADTQHTIQLVPLLFLLLR